MSWIAVAVVGGAAIAGTAQGMATSQANKQAKEGTANMAQIGNEVIQGTQMTGNEQQQYNQSFGIGQGLQGLEQYQAGLGQAPSGYQNAEQLYQQGGPLSQNLYNDVSAQAANPYAGWESSLQPNLALATQNVNQQSNQRGLLNSGINLESLGRAGVELAVADAQNRMAYGQQSIQNASALQTNMYNQQQQGQQSLQNLYGTQQTAGLQALQRQAGGYNTAAQIQAYPYTQQIKNAYNTGAGGQSGQQGSMTFLSDAFSGLTNQMPTQA